MGTFKAEAIFSNVEVVTEDGYIMDKMRAVSCVRDFLRVIEKPRLKD